jgi:hypothetical protein
MGYIDKAFVLYSGYKTLLCYLLPSAFTYWPTALLEIDTRQEQTEIPI